jgi:hypothetical protein
LLVVLAIFYWVAFIRKPGRRRSRHHGGRESSRRGILLTGKEQKRHRRHRSWFRFGTRRRHRRRHRERPRNPSLAEIGGLPPVHNDEPDNRTP